jgi:hypothetical protein
LLALSEAGNADYLVAADKNGLLDLDSAGLTAPVAPDPPKVSMTYAASVHVNAAPLHSYSLYKRFDS